MGKELSISYSCRGRFGNNLFQYFATQVLLKLLNDVSQKHKIGITYVYKYKNEIRPYQPWLESTPEGWFEVTDEKFLKFYDQLKKGEYPKEILNKNLWMFGYYQFDQFLRENIEYVRSLFTSESSHIINDSIAMNNFAHSVKDISDSKPSSDELVLHLRLDDFIQSGGDNNIIAWESYIDLVKKIKVENPNLTKITIVVDKIKREFEGIYVQNLIKRLAMIGGLIVSIRSGSMWSDFAYMYYGEHIILSNSTFSWWATILSDKNKLNWFPNTNGYYSNQIFNKINDNTIVYETKFWR